MKKVKNSKKIFFSTMHLKYQGQGLVFSYSIGVNLGYVHRNCDFTL